MSNHAGLGVNQRADCDDAAISQTTPRGDAGSWWPVQGARVLFMRATDRCPICRMMQIEGASKFGGLLHVVATPNRLIVTEANNLHRPGRVLSGIIISDDVHRSKFQLAAQPPPGLDAARHLPAAGIATLTWGSVRRLQIIATAVGQTNSHDLVVDAIE